MQATVATIAYRCPICRSIDWYRDGCLITEDEATGDLAIVRVQASDLRIAGAGWSCNYCAYEVQPQTRLARDLDDRERDDCA